MGGQETFAGPVDADETYFGGVRAHMPKAKRQELTGRGTVGKTAMAGVKDRATNRVAAPVAPHGRRNLTSLRPDHADKDAVVYTDEHGAYADRFGSSAP